MFNVKNQMKNDPFYGQMFKIAIPIIIQNLLSAAVNSADVFMLNYVGQSSISAVSLASQYANVLFMVYYGLGTGATILCAQYYGKKDYRAIHMVQGIALRFSLGAAVLIALCALLFPNYMMQVFTNDEELIAIGASYIRCISGAYFCWGITEIYISVLRSVNRVMIGTVLNVSAFVLNVLLNAVFIFGLFGAPQLGAMGVALATSISRGLELAGCFVVSAMSRDVKLDLRFLFVKSQGLLQDFIHLALPATGNDVSWGLAYSMYSVILGHLGNDVVAANSIVSMVRNLGSVFCFAIASAGGILLGNIIGENRMEDARVAASRLLKLTFLSGAFGGLVVLVLMPFVLSWASLSDTAMHYLKIMLWINTYYVMGGAVNTTLIAGVFRAGGDTKFGLVCDTIDMWVYALPLGFLSAFVFKFPVMVVYFLLCTDEFVKWPWVFARYRSGKWLKNITRDDLS